MDINRLYRRLGIEEPADIDLDVIAHYLGLSIKVERLCACEARIIGLGDRGIITVNKDSHVRRRRFSIAHEIGHWSYHRGKALMCRASDIGEGREISRHREQVADAFAGRLLLPDFMLKEHSKFPKLTFKQVEKVSTEFDVSRTATARRLVDGGGFPCFLLAYNRNGWKWFCRSPMIPDYWFPQKEIDPQSGVFDAVFAGKDSPYPSKIGADAFFDRRGADRFEVLEESICIGPGDVLTLVTFIDDKMLEDFGSGIRRQSPDTPFWR
ncbi:ImmA/IrrE family metallo-endopeptidase [Caulobacter soli]|uniref:ImmA/IrrE family metallo-endopeptidase n=1 Tax=Caulobacter soli TaxID=2708539 RepID=UPI0013ED587A|nr:ImmA/IrrE family metallo-endopeptidase [Caulobacter soli]